MESGSRPARLLTMKLWRRPQKSVGQKNNPPLSRLGIYSLSPSPQWGNRSVTEVVPITPTIVYPWQNKLPRLQLLLLKVQHVLLFSGLRLATFEIWRAMYYPYNLLDRMLLASNICPNKAVLVPIKPSSTEVQK